MKMADSDVVHVDGFNTLEGRRDAMRRCFERRKREAMDEACVCDLLVTAAPLLRALPEVHPVEIDRLLESWAGLEFRDALEAMRTFVHSNWEPDETDASRRLYDLLRGNNVPGRWSMNISVDI